MNSGISKFEKSIEECVNYNFDDQLPPEKPKRGRKRRTKSISDTGTCNVDTNDTEISPLQPKCDIPAFMPTAEWTDLRANFPWLYFKWDLFRCSFCETGFEKQRKSMFPTQWTCPPDNRASRPTNPAQKSFRSPTRFEKHQMTINHVKAIEIIKSEVKQATQPTEVREVKLPTKKPIVFSPPNVTTRTAVMKSQSDRNSVPAFLDAAEWAQYRAEFPWVYCGRNILCCALCEDAYKAHSDAMTATIWTCPDTVTYKTIASLNHMKSKFRLSRHETTKNHELAVEYSRQEAIMSSAIEDQPVVVIPDFRVPCTVRPSRKSAPVKLENRRDPEQDDDELPDKPNPSKPRKKRNSEANITANNSDNNPTGVSAPPMFCSDSQFASMKSRYPWVTIGPKRSSYGCTVCQRAIGLEPDTIAKTHFTNGLEPFPTNATYHTFRKKLYRHSESRNHNASVAICKQHDDDDNNNKSTQKTTAATSPARFTRLKSGSRSKIDYKRMSEGFVIDQQAPSPSRKRRESLPIGWTCPQCASHFGHCDALVRHISLCDYLLDDTRQLACPCNTAGELRFNAITKLDLHAAQEHDTVPLFHCYICSDRYDRLVALYRHMLLHHMLITWDPFEAYQPPPEPAFLCVLCAIPHDNGVALFDHYQDNSDCSSRLQPLVLVDDIYGQRHSQQQEEVTILDVDELPEEQEVVTYSPVKKLNNQHNTISRNHPLRRFAGTAARSGRKSRDTPKKSKPVEHISTTIDEIVTELTKLDESEKSRSEEILEVNEKSENVVIEKGEENESRSKVDLVNESRVNSEPIGESRPGTDLIIEIRPRTDLIIESRSNSEHIDESRSKVDLPEENRSIVELVEESRLNIEPEQSVVNNEPVLEESVSNMETGQENGSIIEPEENKSVNEVTEIVPIVEVKENEVSINATQETRSAEIVEPVVAEDNVKQRRTVKKSFKVLDNAMELMNVSSKSSKSSKSSNNTNKLKGRRSTVKRPVGRKPSKPRPEMAHVVDLTDIMRETELSTTPVVAIAVATAIVAPVPVITPPGKKQPIIRIQSQVSPGKKLKAIEPMPVSTPSAAAAPLTAAPPEDNIPEGLSFMERMKKIRQLKKSRTEHQRQQMMAVDRKIAELNDKSPRGPSLVDKSERIRKLINSDQYSMEELKNIIALETHRKVAAAVAEKRKSQSALIINNSNSHHHHNNGEAPSKLARLDPLATTIIAVSALAAPPPVALATQQSPSKGELFSCDVCPLKFKSFRARDNHATADHKGLKLFCCKVCEMSFTTHILLRKHAQKYHIDNVSLAVFGRQNSTEIDFSFQCSFCPLQFTSRSGLNHHITSGHKLDQDNGTVVAADDFLSKLIIADPRFSPQSCLICQEIMDNEFELDIHTIEHQKECQSSEMEPTQFACPKCCRLFFGRDGKSYLKDHYNIVHLGKPLPACEECETRFVSTVCYSLHRKLAKNCSKKTADQLKIDDPYEKLNDPMKLAFACSRCQALMAGESAATRFEQHQIQCNVAPSSPSHSGGEPVAPDTQPQGQPPAQPQSQSATQPPAQPSAQPLAQALQSTAVAVAALRGDPL